MAILASLESTVNPRPSDSVEQAECPDSVLERWICPSAYVAV